MLPCLRRIASTKRILWICRCKGVTFHPKSTDAYLEGVDGLEPMGLGLADFMEGDKMHNTRGREITNSGDKKQLDIVKRKYFKSDIQPNFLTWAEKEQIRYLHSNDPHEWSTEKLAESFPASEITIKKIIKAKWEADGMSGIRRHDQSVEKNWKALFFGNLEVEPILKVHLFKFARREQATLAHKFMAQTDSIKPTNSLSGKSGEFSSIIDSYKNVGVSSQKEPFLPLHHNPSNTDEPGKTKNHLGLTKNGDTYVLDGIESKKTKKHFTLEQYKQDFNFNPTYQIDKSIVEDNLQSNDGTKNIETKELKSSITLRQNKTSLANLDKSNFNNYPENILIPKDKWKAGGTYKIGDCYYDDDGEFLYRVPGMK